MSVRTNDPRPPEIYKPALCAAGCGKEYQSICGKCNLAYCSDHLKAPHACGNWPATRLATPEPDPAKSDTPEYAVGQQLAPGLVVVHEETLKKLQGPFTCGHPAEFAGGACAACHALTLEKLDAANLQMSELQEDKEALIQQRDRAHAAADGQEKDLEESNRLNGEMLELLRQVNDLYTGYGLICGPIKDFPKYEGTVQQGEWIGKVRAILRASEKQKCLHGGVFRGEKCGTCGEEVR